MSNKILFWLLVVVVIAGVGFTAAQSSGVVSSDTEGNATVATIYKSSSCGCCGVYTSYLGREGYDVAVKNVQDVSSIKRKMGVPQELESCHTTAVGGYIVEGHIPEEAIRKLLAERPDIAGIGMPGMPSGSPGMPGPKTEDFVVYEITKEGVMGDVFLTL